MILWWNSILALPSQANILLKLIWFFFFFTFLLEIVKLHVAHIIFPLDSIALQTMVLLLQSRSGAVQGLLAETTQPEAPSQHLSSPDSGEENVGVSYHKTAQETEQLSEANFAFCLNANTGASKT